MSTHCHVGPDQNTTLNLGYKPAGSCSYISLSARMCVLVTRDCNTIGITSHNFSTQHFISVQFLHLGRSTSSIYSMRASIDGRFCVYFFLTWRTQKLLPRVFRFAFFGSPDREEDLTVYVCTSCAYGPVLLSPLLLYCPSRVLVFVRTSLDNQMTLLDVTPRSSSA